VRGVEAFWSARYISAEDLATRIYDGTPLTDRLASAARILTPTTTADGRQLSDSSFRRNLSAVRGEAYALAIRRRFHPPQLNSELQAGAMRWLGHHIRNGYPPPGSPGPAGCDVDAAHKRSRFGFGLVNGVHDTAI
jgi:hypothetical protein